MKKKIIIIISFIAILLIASSVLFNNVSKNKSLTKVKVADTAITSWT